MIVYVGVDRPQLSLLVHVRRDDLGNDSVDLLVELLLGHLILINVDGGRRPGSIARGVGRRKANGIIPGHIGNNGRGIHLHVGRTAAIVGHHYPLTVGDGFSHKG